MRRLPRIASSSYERTSSWPLRRKLRSPLRNRFLASCWVIVEPPTTFGRRRPGARRRLRSRLRRRAAAPAAPPARRPSARSFLPQAFSSASHSTPLCSVKPLSSAAMTARFRFAEIARVVDPALLPPVIAGLEREAPGFRALEGRRLRIDDRHQGDPRQKVELQRDERDDHEQRQAAEREAARHRHAAARRSRSARSTGAVSGSTPRQNRNASAACSTSMPRPSRPIAPCSRRPGEEAVGGRAVHHVEGQRAAAAGRSPRPAPARRRRCSRWR